MTQEELLLKLSVSMTGMKEVIRDYEKLIDGNKKTQTAIEKLGKEYATMTKVNKLLHNGVKDTSTHMAMLETTIKSLIANGIKPASKEVQSLTNEYKKLEKEQANMDKGGGMFNDIAQGILGANVAMGIFNKTVEAVVFTIKTGFDFNRMMESSQMALGVMFRSQETAISLISQFKTLSAQTGISLQDASEGAKQLSAYGFGADTLVDNMKMLGTVSKAVGTSLGDLTYVYGTLRSQGRAYTRDLMQFAMRGIPIYEELGAVLGVDGSQIKKMAEDGKIGFKEVEMAFKNMTSEGGKFAGMLEKAMDTVDGKLAKLDNNFKQFAGNLVNNDIAKGFLDVANGVMEDSNAIKTGQSLVKASIQAINKEMENSDDLAKKVRMNFVSMYTEGDFQAKKFLEDVNNQNLALEAQGEEYANLIKKARELQGLTPGGAVKKEAPVSIDTKALAISMGAVGAVDSSIRDKLQAIGLQVRNSMLSGAPDEQMVQEIQKKFAIPWQTAVKALASVKPMLQSEYNALLSKSDQFSVSFAESLKRAFNPATGNKALAESEVTNYMTNMQKEFDNIVRQGFTMDNTGLLQFKEAQSDMAKTIVSDLESQLQSLGTFMSTLTNDKDKATTQKYMDEIIAKIQKMRSFIIPTKKATKEVEDNFWQQYIANRKNVDTTLEGLAVQQKLVSVIGQQLTGDAGLDAINLKYAIQRKEVEKITNEEERKLRLQTLQLQKLEEQKKVYEDIYNKSKDTGMNDVQKQVREETGKELSEIMEKGEKRQNEYNSAMKELQAQQVKNANEAMSKQGWTQKSFDEAVGRASTEISKASSDAINNKQEEDTKAKWDSIGISLAGQLKEMWAGTQVGALATTGTTGGDPVVMLIKMVVSGFMNMLAGMENLSSILNPISVIIDGFGEAMAIVDSVLKPIAVMFKNLGKVLGVVLLPILVIVAEVLSSFAEGVNSILEPFLALFGLATEQVAIQEEQNKKLEDLYDKNLKSLQDLYNVGAISGIEYEARLAQMGTRPEDVDITASIMEEQLTVLKEQLALMKPMFDYIFGIGASIGNVIVTALSGLGGILGGIGTMIAGLFSFNTELIGKGFMSLVNGLVSLLTAPMNLVIDMINGVLQLFSIPLIPRMPMPQFAVGTANLPQDTMAQVHKGEGIVPATFMESIRRGDLSLSGGKDSNSNVQPIVVNVYGTVTSERDLVKFIAKELPKASKLGYV